MTSMEDMWGRNEYYLLGLVHTVASLSMDGLKNELTLTDVSTLDEVVRNLIPEWLYHNQNDTTVNAEVVSLTKDLVNTRGTRYEFDKTDAPNLIHWANLVMGHLGVTYDEVVDEFTA